VFSSSTGEGLEKGRVPCRSKKRVRSDSAPALTPVTTAKFGRDPERVRPATAPAPKAPAAPPPESARMFERFSRMQCAKPLGHSRGGELCKSLIGIERADRQRHFHR